MGLGLLLGALGIGSAALALAMNSFERAGSWSRDIHQLVSEKDRLAGRRVKATGTLVPGSLRKREQPCEYRFDLTQGGATLPVRYAGCVVPDSIREVPGMDVMVTVDGELDPAGHFEASQVMVRLPPQKYEMR